MMKTLLRILTLALALAGLTNFSHGQTTGDHRTVSSGPWNNAAVWERFNGTAWEAAVTSPTSSANTITVLSPHVVNISANLTVDQLVVSSGGQVVVDSAITLTIANGAGTDLDVSGVVSNAGTISSTGATIVFGPTGFYQHNFTTTAGTIPTATWNSTSTCEIIGYVSSAASPSGLGQSFGNFTWNSPNQTNIMSLGGLLTSVAGNLRIVSTGTGALRIATTSASFSSTIAGDFIMEGGSTAFTTSGTSTINVTGNVDISGGTLSMSDGTGSSTLNVTGNFSHTGGTITEISSGSGTIRFVKSGMQTYTSGGTVLNTIHFTVLGGSTLNMGTSAITGGGNFTLSSGAALGIGSPQGITTTATGAVGNIQVTGTRSYNTAAGYIYNGTAAQTAGNGLPTTVGSLTIDNPAGFALPGNLVCSGDLNLLQGNFSTGGFTLSVGGNWTNSAGTLDATGTTVTFTGASKTIGGGTSTSFNNITFATGASYTLGTSISVGNLTFNAASTATSLSHLASGSMVVSGNVTITQPSATGITTAWNINAGSANVSGNISIGGNNTTVSRIARIVITTGTLTVGGNLVFNSSATTAQTAVVDMSTGGGTGTLNLAGSMTLTNNTGTITPGTSGSIFNYNGSGAGQTVVLGSAITYNDLHLSNTHASGASLGATVTASNVTGNIRVQSGTFNNGGFAIAGNGSKTFEVRNAATFRLSGASGMVTGFGTRTFATGSTVDFAGTGAQTIAAENYGGLTVSGSRTTSNVTFTSGTIGIAGTFNPSATFTSGSYVLTGNTMDFNGTGSQTVPAFNYNNLTVSGARTSNNITFSSSGVIRIPGVFNPSATFTSGQFITAGSTIEFTGGAQSVPAFPYHHLTTANTGTKSAAGSIIVNGTLMTAVGTTFDAGSFAHQLRGNLINNGTINAGTSSIAFNGTLNQSISGNDITFNNLTLNNTAGAALTDATITINGVLTLTNGAFTTNGEQVVIPTSGSVSRTNGQIAGNLQKHVATGTPTRVFEIGDGTSYTPVTLQFANVTSAGNLTARTTNGDHPEIKGSGLKPQRTVNRYYKLTNAGVEFSTYDAIFSFTSIDVDPGADPNLFMVRKYDASSWSLTTTGTRTSTSTQALGLNSFSDFAIGEPGAAFPGTSTVDASPSSIAANGTSTSAILVQLKDDQGINLTTGGDSVAITSSLGAVGNVTDNNDGTYSALLTSSTVAGTAVIRAYVNTFLISDSALVVLTPGPASTATSTITPDPSTLVANGISTSIITVQLKDQFGNNVNSSAGTVALFATLGSLGAVVDSANGRYGAILTSTTTLGTATISGTLNGAPISDTAHVSFTAGNPSQLAWTHQPKDTVAGRPIPANSFPTVEIRDNLGNRVEGATNSVTITIGTNPGAGTLSGTVTRNAVNGIVDFTDLSINKSGMGYTLIASSGALTRDTSDTFTISPSTPTQLAFVQQPTNSVTGQPITPAITVQLRDAFGNNVPQSGDSITVTLSTGTGTLSGTTARVTDVVGIATFNDLSINAVGSKRLTASRAGLTNAVSNLFTVNPAPSTLVSDDFNAFQLNPNVWTFINPFNDGTMGMSGTNTQNAAVTMSVPGGTEHNPWTGGINAPRIMQNANNTDFEVEVKILTGVSQKYQLQGIVVEQDSLNFMRFETFSDGLGTRVFVASIINNSPTSLVNLNIGANSITPLWLRVKRQGNDWTQYYSLNGTAWNPTGTFTQALNVARVGLFTGNTNTPPSGSPAHTANFDYFFNTVSPINPEDGGTAVDSIPPVISGIQVVATDSNATVTWNTNERASSIVSYGLTAGYELGAVSNAALTTTHSIVLSGLSAQRLYHFRVSSADTFNNTAISPDSTFNTADSVLAISDDFNAFRLNNRWTFINPLGDASFSLVGQNTSNAWARIAVPGGTSHQPWTGGNTAPRIMQSTNNKDFEFEVKFESPVTQAFQIQGLMVEQDANNYLRFDFNSGGSSTRAFAAIIKAGTPITRINNLTIGTNGIAPTYMRVKRAGHSWTMSYSTNGTSWTQVGSTFLDTLVAGAVGIFIGNTGSPTIPAHTGTIDYFFKSSSPIIPEDGGVAIDDVPPVISNIQTSTTGTTATVTWTTNEPATSSVAYGPTAAYEGGTVSDPVLRTSHSITVRNLVASSVYHFRVTSADSGNNIANSQDSTLQTGPPSNIVSDDFNSYGLNLNLWTFINPAGDATLAMANTNTDSAWATIQVPGGSTHQPYPGNPQAPRIMQPADNSDFEVEVKFDSRTSQQYQFQGIVVEQNATNYLRFDLYSNGANTRVFAASISGGVATIRVDSIVAPNNITPQYMRLRREGNLWTQSYSLNGSVWKNATSFSHSLAVSSVGPFIGNGIGASSPALLGKIDYFFNTSSPINPEDGGIAPDTIPPVITNVQVGLVGSLATITWNTNEPATSNVSFGLTPAYELGSLSDTTLRTSHSMRVLYLTGNTTYHFRVSSADSNANVRFSNDGTFTTGPASNIVSDDFNSGSLNSNIWTFINPRSDAALAMANTGTDSAWVTINVPAGLSHQPWTDGNFAPRIMQPCSNTDFEVEAKFEAPLSQAYRLQGIIVQQDSLRYLRFDFYSSASNTNVFAASFQGATQTTYINTTIGATGIAPQYMRVRRVGNQWTLYRSFDGTSWTQAVTFASALTVNAIGPFIGNNGTTANNSPQHLGKIDYFFNAASPIVPEDGADTTPPIISNLQVVPLATQATISWTTNEPATSIVSYGPTSAYENGSITNPSFVTNHSVTLTGLNQASLYHFRVGSRDASTNLAQSGDSTFTTIDSLPPVISNVTISVGATQATIQWVTDKAATSTVQFGPTIAYENGSVQDTARVMNHSIVLPGLQQETTYHFRVVSVDVHGNIGTSGDSTFVTHPAAIVSRVKVILQGPHAAGSDSMTSLLNSFGHLPLLQPYSGSPWNYTGDNEQVVAMPDSVVDWVLLELHSAAQPQNVLARRAALLTRRGLVTDTNGSLSVSFEGIAPGSYYIAVHHRNHLSIMSAQPVTLGSTSALYDFTTSQSQAFGTNPMAGLSGGVFGMRSGDGNADGSVNATDRASVWRPQNGTPGSYAKSGDFNMDGAIDALDLNEFWRPNNGQTTQVPQQQLQGKQRHDSDTID